MKSFTFRAFGLLAPLLAGCLSRAETEVLEGSAVRSDPLLYGAASPPSEDYAVLVETRRAPDDGGVASPARCSGSLIDPRIVVTARHCAGALWPGKFGCTVDGEQDGLTPTTGSMVPVDAITVIVGHTLPARQTLKPVAIVATSASTVCRDDIAFLVLDAPADAPTVRFGTTEPRRGDRFTFSGWGLTETAPPSSGYASAPNERFARTEIAIDEVGPGRVPERSFATPGRTVCFGDSGGGAVRDGEVIGVYSRLDGPCDAVTSQNIFTKTAPFIGLAEEAFALVGRSPPWQLDAGPRTAETNAELGGTPAPLRRTETTCDFAGARAGGPSPALAFSPLAVLLAIAARRRRVD